MRDFVRGTNFILSRIFYVFPQLRSGHLQQGAPLVFTNSPRTLICDLLPEATPVRKTVLKESSISQRPTSSTVQAMIPEDKIEDTPAAEDKPVNFSTTSSTTSEFIIPLATSPKRTCSEDMERNVAGQVDSESKLTSGEPFNQNSVPAPATQSEGTFDIVVGIRNSDDQVPLYLCWGL